MLPPSLTRFNYHAPPNAGVDCEGEKGGGIMLASFDGDETPSSEEMLCMSACVDQVVWGFA